MSTTAKGRIIIIITALLWGLTGVCVKSISWSTPAIICSRAIISFFMLYAFRIISMRKADPTIKLVDTLKIEFTKGNIIATLSITATSILYVQAIKLTTAGTAIVLQYVAPIFVFLFAIIFQKRKAKISEVILTLLVFGGCVLSFVDNIDMTHILGNCLALLSGITYAAQIITMNGKEVDGNGSLILSNALSFCICLPIVLASPPLSFDAKNVVWMLILGIFQYGAANLLFAVGIKMIDKIEASLLLCIEPIFNPIPVAILCGENMGVLAIIGSIIVIIGIALYGLVPALQKKKETKHLT